MYVIENLIFSLCGFFALSLLLIIKLFLCHTKKVLDLHVGRHIQPICTAVCSMRDQVVTREVTRLCRSHQIEPSVTVQIDERVDGEELVILCTFETEAFAQDLAYWLLETKALHFEVKAVSRQEYDDILVVPEA